MPEWLRIKAADFGHVFAYAEFAGWIEASHGPAPGAEVPESLGVLEQGDGDVFHDRRRPLHAGLRVLRSVHEAKPLALEVDEPARVAEATRRMKLKHVVITAVARDDLKDGGAERFCKRRLRRCGRRIPELLSRCLPPIFWTRTTRLKWCWPPSRTIFNHNLETVRRLTPSVRSRATYDRSLSVLEKQGEGALACARDLHESPGVMLGLGETEEELSLAMEDLRRVGCEILLPDAGAISATDVEAAFAGEWSL